MEIQARRERGGEVKNKFRTCVLLWQCEAATAEYFTAENVMDGGTDEIIARDTPAWSASLAPLLSKRSDTACKSAPQRFGGTSDVSSGSSTDL
jgi:hypothetical protein